MKVHGYVDVRYKLALRFSPRAKLRRILVLRLLWRLNRTEPLRNCEITPIDHSSGISFIAWKLEKLFRLITNYWGVFQCEMQANPKTAISQHTGTNPSANHWNVNIYFEDRLQNAIGCHS